MASKLFHSVIASSVMLLSGATTTLGCAALAVRDGEDGSDGGDAAIADVLHDARSEEAGWPTTKGITCTTPTTGAIYCCRMTESARECTIPSLGDLRCDVDDSSGQCVPVDAGP